MGRGDDGRRSAQCLVVTEAGPCLAPLPCPNHPPVFRGPRPAGRLDGVIAAARVGDAEGFVRCADYYLRGYGNDTVSEGRAPLPLWPSFVVGDHLLFRAEAGDISVVVAGIPHRAGTGWNGITVLAFDDDARAIVKWFETGPAGTAEASTDRGPVRARLVAYFRRSSDLIEANLALEPAG
jgi:hypothetical protein